MKNIFAFKYNKANTKEIYCDGECFITKKVGNNEEKLLDENMQLAIDTTKKYSIPIYLQLIKGLFNLLGFIFFIFLMRVAFEINFKTAYNNVPYVFYIGLFSVFVSLIFFWITRKKNKQFIECPELKTLEKQGKMIENNAKRAFDIPEDARKVEILSYLYNEKNGKSKIYGVGVFKYTNIEMFVYIKYKYLYFADGYSLISIPLTSLVHFKKIKRRTTIPYWNKEEAFNSEKYKKNKIKTNNFGFLIKYYSLYINDPKGKFEIFIPNYDMEELADLLDIEKEGNW